MDRRTREIAFLAGIVYFTQGALGIAGIALPLYLRGLGWSVSEITTISSVVAFPWVIKILYGLLSDCLPLLKYRRKSYLVLFACASTLGWGGLALLAADRWIIISAMIVSNLGLAATDVITDGFIVEHSKGEKSHIFQSVAWGTRSVGAILSGFAGGWLAEHWEARYVFMIAALLPLITVGVAFRLREIRIKKKTFLSFVDPFRRCLRLLLEHNLRWFILLIVLSQVASSFGLPFFFHMKENLLFRESFLGLLISVGWAGVVIASLIYARWLRKLPPPTILRWAFLCAAANILSTLLIRDRMTALVLVFLGGMLACITLLPILSISALLTYRSGVEGTLFAVLMSIHNLGQISFGFIGGRLYNRVGLETLIFFSAAISLLAMLFISKLRFEDAEGAHHGP
ncbi:MAG: MFS transporter [Candidatus Omnitrophota bacterium]